MDLPQPLSPTTPRVSPLRTVNDTPSTARTALPPLPFTGKCFFSSRAINSGCRGPPRSRGSRAGICIAYIRTSIAARSPSLTRLKQIEATKIAIPGKAQT